MKFVIRYINGSHCRQIIGLEKDLMLGLVKLSGDIVSNPVVRSADLLDYRNELEPHHQEQEFPEELGHLWVGRLLHVADIYNSCVVAKELYGGPCPTRTPGSHGDEQNPVLQLMNRLGSPHSKGKGSAPVLVSVVATTPQQASITCVAMGDKGRVDNEPNAIELPDVCIPPENVQLHVSGNGQFVVLFRESLQARQESADETS